MRGTEHEAQVRERLQRLVVQLACPARALGLGRRQALMPALYRSADALVFPSIKEGFGLVVLEAMASGVPVVTSRIAPFTEYLGDGDVLWCDPHDTGSIAAAMAAALEPAAGAAVVARGFAVAARHDWATAARAHLPAYEALSEVAYA